MFGRLNAFFITICIISLAESNVMPFYGDAGCSGERESRIQFHSLVALVGFGFGLFGVWYARSTYTHINVCMYIYIYTYIRT